MNEQQPPTQNYPRTEATNNLLLNYILSVFFTWIPALIFYLLEKDKGDERLRQLHTQNMNFQILRFIVGICWAIPFVNILAIIFSIVLFAFQIVACARVNSSYTQGQPATPFLLNIPILK